MSKVLIIETCDVDLWDKDKARQAHEDDINRCLEENDGFRVGSINTICGTTTLRFGGNDQTTVPKWRSVLVLEPVQK